MANENRKFKIAISIILAVALLWTAALSVMFFLHSDALKSLCEDERQWIYVCGREVTRKNSDDILGDGTVSYDIYNNILTLSNAHLEYAGPAVILAEKDLSIALDGENTIVCTGEDTAIGVYASNLMLRKDVCFIGAGSLLIEGRGGANATAGGIVANDIWAYSDVSIDLVGAPEDSIGIECSYLGLMEGCEVSVKVDSTGESGGIYVRGDLALMDDAALEVVNTKNGANSRGIECTGSLIANEGSTISSTAGENEPGVLCHGVFVNCGATLNTQINAMGGTHYE